MDARFLRPLLFASLAILLFNYISITFFSQYYNYVGESVGLHSVLRLAEGKPVLSGLGEIPSNLNPYGPPLIYPIGAVFWLFGITSPYVLGIVTKTLTFLLFLGVALVSIRFNEREFTGKKQAPYIWAGLLYFLVMFPEMALNFRNDILAVGLELLGFFAVYQSLGLRKNKFKRIALAGLFFSLACLTKANEITLLPGVFLYLYFQRKHSLALTLIASFAASTGLGALILHLIFGEMYWINVIFTSGHGMVSLPDLPNHLSTVFTDVLLKHSVFHALVLFGVCELLKNFKHAKIYFWGLASTFVLASVGQLKVGAHYNYYIVYFMLGLVPASYGIKALISQSGQIWGALRVFVLAASPVVLGVALLPGLSAALNDARNYPHGEVKNYIEANFPNAKIYTPDPSLTLHHYGKTLLGPWDERIHEKSPYFRTKGLPLLHRELRKHHFNLAVIPGRGCSKWRPSGILIEHISHLVRLERKFKKICLFARR